MCMPGRSSENRIDGVRPGMRQSGASASAAMVAGQRAMFSSTGSPAFQR